MERKKRGLRVYTTPKCSRCRQLKRWLKARGYEFEELDLSNTEVLADLIMKDVYAASSPILGVEDRFILAQDLFEGGRLNEKFLLEALKACGR
ncbi:MAG: NrdH-redoxin [Candidatus Brockarchaeota archaeon]|nr:NrdH-redoxin [Candidatus Brockarchaeota archaeon]